MHKRVDLCYPHLFVLWMECKKFTIRLLFLDFYFLLLSEINRRLLKQKFDTYLYLKPNSPKKSLILCGHMQRITLYDLWWRHQSLHGYVTRRHPAPLLTIHSSCDPTTLCMVSPNHIFTNAHFLFTGKKLHHSLQIYIITNSRSITWPTFHVCPPNLNLW